MKRFNKTAIAIALSGAMALGVAPTAGAATPVTLQQGDLVYDKDGNLKTSFGGTDNGMATLEEGDVVYNSKSENVTADRTANAPAANEDTSVSTTPVTLNKGDRIVDFAGNEKLVADQDGQFAVLEPGDRVIAKGGEEVTNTRTGSEGENAPRPVTLGWGEAIVDKDGKIVYFAKKDGESAVLQPGDKVVPVGKIGAGILGGLTAVTIAGILYNVVKNSQGENVLVPADRPDQTPTAEDKAKTDELVAEHGDEIAQQATIGTDAEAGDSAAQTGGERGMGATTGNNSIAQGLLALLVASVMGAAAFAFGRRRLV